MGLRCDPGDMAVVIGGPMKLPTEGVIGAFVKVVRMGTCDANWHRWVLERPLQARVFALGSWRSVEIVEIADECLQPIRPPAPERARPVSEPMHA